MNKNSQKALVAGLLVALTGILMVSVASAHHQEPERENVTTLLKAYDAFPKATTFKSVAEDPRTILLEIVSDSTEPEIVRLQALDALSLFPDGDVRQVFRQVVADSWDHTLAPRATHNAINGLMYGWGEAALDDVLPLLSHPDLQVRLTVVHAVGKSGGDVGRAALRAQLADEKDPYVREAIQKHANSIR
jgi:hypothetical protein